jgi:hypothetical protein
MEELAMTMNFCNIKKGDWCISLFFLFLHGEEIIEQSQYTNFANSLKGNFGLQSS